MGLIDWIRRKKETARLRNEAKEEAKRQYYRSKDFKQDIARQLKEKKGSTMPDWMKRGAENIKKEFGSRDSMKFGEKFKQNLEDDTRILKKNKRW